jgi:hypothetical protein
VNGPIDGGTISFKAMMGIMVAAFAVGGWAVSLELRQQELADRLSANGKLLAGICRAVECDAKGMRE